jgi:glycosyltransferase involved in cell wall biosynthesis
MARLLAEHGETVHVIGQMWRGATQQREERYHGRLIIHRLPFEAWHSLLGLKPHPTLIEPVGRALFASSYYPQCFAWQASLLAEQLVMQEEIDLIEAQEYEAPLYYLQLRRALGLGPTKQPPCLIHLHSPSDCIARANDWPMGLPAVVTARRLEAYSMAAADTLLSPSRTVARQLEAHYGFAAHTIQVIPYPMGAGEPLERAAHTWEHGTICYIGRLERRKGILEWLDAAVAVAPAYPQARFAFVGANCLGTDELHGAQVLAARIPSALRHRFRFYGLQKRAALQQFLAQARLAVFPARWENFPYACIEAMSSGLPVLASAAGGLVDMIDDGQTGWIARTPGSEGLTEALTRALHTPPSRMATMGRQAATAMQQRCNNHEVLAQHLALRRQLVQQGAQRSRGVSVGASRRHVEPVPGPVPAHEGTGLAIVVTYGSIGASLEASVQSVQQQTNPPAAVAMVARGQESAATTCPGLSQAPSAGWLSLRTTTGDNALAWNAGIEAILRTGITPLGFLFLDAGDCLEPRCLAVCGAVLQHCPEVGLVSFWTAHSAAPLRLHLYPCPSFPYQWLANEATPLSIIRTQALSEADNFRSLSCADEAAWDLCNAVMVAGWQAVTVPEVLGTRCGQPAARGPASGMAPPHLPSRELLSRFPERLAQDAAELALLASAAQAPGSREARHTVRAQVEVLGAILTHPAQALRLAGWVYKRLMHNLHRAWQ